MNNRLGVLCRVHHRYSYSRFQTVIALMVDGLPHQHRSQDEHMATIETEVTANKAPQYEFLGALVAGVAYAGFLHTRISHGWRGRRSAYFALLGFALVIFTWFGVSCLLPGLHSYA